MKISFITNMCTHYVSRLFELLSRQYDIDFYFTGGDECYWNKENRPATSSICGKYLKRIILFSKIKIMPGVIGLPFKKADVCIKTIDGRFALPFIFLGAKLFGRPFVLWTGLWSHPQTIIHKITFPFTKFIYKHSNAIVAYGEHVKRYLVDLGIEPKKIFCAPHSIDNGTMNRSVSCEQIMQLKGKLGLSDAKVILYVGRFEECKGLDFLVDGLSQIKNQDFTILFIGNGSQEEAMKRRCSELSVKAKFLGHIANEDLYQYYALADIFVLPSITTRDFKEPWGLVINEAMNQGCPVVTTDAVGAAAGGLVEDGKNGYIVPEKNSEALKEIVEKLLQDDSRRLEMGRNAGEKIKTWTPQRTMEGFVRAIDYVKTN